MQIPIFPHRGQKQPWTSIPRINWRHPLTPNLITYIYDCGGGVKIDLVNGGGIGQKSTIGVPVQPIVAPSKYGAGWRLGDNGGGGANGAYILCPFVPKTDNMAANPPYTFASGFMQTAAVVTGGWVYCISRNNGNHFALQSGNPVVVAFGNSGSGTAFTSNVSVGAFSTLIGSCVSATSGTSWFMDSLGHKETVTTATITLDAVTACYPCFGDLSNGTYPGNVGALTSTNHNGFTGFVYYGAAWRGRALTQNEATLLHNDPYCFLIYPEDEMMALGVGSAFTWSQTSDEQLLIPRGHLIREMIRHD